jgi:hypothetical protein
VSAHGHVGGADGLVAGRGGLAVGAVFFVVAMAFAGTARRGHARRQLPQVATQHGHGGDRALAPSCCRRAEPSRWPSPWPTIPLLIY